MYVKRGSDGDILAISILPEPGFEEQLDAAHPELQAFCAAAFTGLRPLSKEARELRLSDAELVRVVEDIVNLLMDKGLMQFTELPQAAQEKLLQRKSLRRHVRKLDLLDEDDQESLMP